MPAIEFIALPFLTVLGISKVTIIICDRTEIKLGHQHSSPPLSPDSTWFLEELFIFLDLDGFAFAAVGMRSE
jgi:hypothetical protein